MTADPHDRFDELVAGHALSALEPEDEQLLLAHLPSCAACERSLDVHRETLAHLAYAVDAPPPLPDSVWAGIRAEVLASGSPASFDDDDDDAAEDDAVHAPVPAPVDLAAERRARRTRRAVAMTSAAAAVALVGALLSWNLVLQRERDEMGAVSERLAAAVQAVETAPAQTVPLRAKDGAVAAVAVLHRDRMSLVVDGLAPNDPSSSIYVLWGQSGNEPAAALASFDVQGDVSVVRDLALPTAGGPAPELLVITREPGRTAPAVTAQAALATGRTV